MPMRYRSLDLRVIDIGPASGAMSMMRLSPVHGDIERLDRFLAAHEQRRMTMCGYTTTSRSGSTGTLWAVVALGLVVTGSDMANSSLMQRLRHARGGGNPTYLSR